MELNVEYYGGRMSALPPLLLVLNSTDGGLSPDLITVSLPVPSDIAHGCADVTPSTTSTCAFPVDTNITIAETKTPEIRGGAVFTVAWAADAVPQELQVNRSKSHCIAFCSYRIETLGACMLLQFVSSYSSSSWGVPDPLAAAVAALRRLCFFE
jgi:hypothetical protein